MLNIRIDIEINIFTISTEVMFWLCKSNSENFMFICIRKRSYKNQYRIIRVDKMKYLYKDLLNIRIEWIDIIWIMQTNHAWRIILISLHWKMIRVHMRLVKLSFIMFSSSFLLICLDHDYGLLRNKKKNMQL